MDLATDSAALSNLKTAAEIAKFIKDTDTSLEKSESKLKLAYLIAALAEAKIKAASIQQVFQHTKTSKHSLVFIIPHHL